MHGRDHRPGGADPIPGVGSTGARIQRLNSPQTTANNTNTDVLYDTVDFDTADMADLSAPDRLTVQIPGVYLVMFQVVYASNATGRRIGAITINYLYSGTLFGSNASLSLNAISGGKTSVPVSAVFFLSQGDFIASGAFQASGGNLTIDPGTNVFLSAYLLGAT